MQDGIHQRTVANIPMGPEFLEALGRELGNSQGYPESRRVIPTLACV